MGIKPAKGKFDIGGVCDICGKTINPGQYTYWIRPKVYCEPCGDAKIKEAKSGD